MKKKDYVIEVKRQIEFDVPGANECIKGQSEMLPEYTPTQINLVLLHNKGQCADESVFKDSIDHKLNDLDNYEDSSRAACRMDYKHAEGHQKNPQRRKFHAELIHRIETKDTQKLTDRFKSQWFVTEDFVKKQWAKKDDKATYGHYFDMLNPQPGAEFLINERVRRIISFNVWGEILGCKDIMDAFYEIKIPPTSTVERTEENEEQLIAALRKRWKNVCITFEGRPTLLHDVYGYKTKNNKYKIGKFSRKPIDAKFVREYVQNCPSKELDALVNEKDWEMDDIWLVKFNEEDGSRIKPCMVINFLRLGPYPTLEAFYIGWKNKEFDFVQIYEDITANYATPYVFEKSFWRKYKMVNEEADWDYIVKLATALYLSPKPLITEDYSNKTLQQIWKGKDLMLQMRIVQENGNTFEDVDIPDDTTISGVAASVVTEASFETAIPARNSALKLKSKTDRVFNPNSLSNVSALIHSKIDGTETISHAEAATFAASVSQSHGISINEIPKTDNFLCQSSMIDNGTFGLYYNSYGWGIQREGKLIDAIRIQKEFMEPFAEWVCIAHIYIYNMYLQVASLCLLCL